MTTIQERLRMSAAVPIPETDEGMMLATVQAAMRAHHSLHRKAAAEIDRLQAALKASDEALLWFVDRFNLADLAKHGLPGSVYHAITAARSRPETKL